MNQSPLRIAVLAGGLSHERDISLRSGHRVAQVLKHLGHTVLVLDIDARTIGSLKTFGPDVVWPLVHGGPGEDGGLQNMLIALGCRTSARTQTVANGPPLNRPLRRVFEPEE